MRVLPLISGGRPAMQVAFALVEYSGLSLMSLMSYSLHALPVLQVNAGVSAEQQGG